MSGMALSKTKHPRPKRVGKNSTFGEKAAVRTHGILAQVFGGRTVLKLAGTLLAVLIIAGTIFWYKAIYADPEHVFWGMVDNNLSTPSISKEILQTGNAAASKEQTQLSFTPSPVVRDIKDVVSQNSENSSHIKIESIGTPADTYQHYVLIDQSSKTGKSKHDYSKVYSMWLKNSGNPQGDTQLFNNTIFSAVLFGNQTPQQRANTTKKLRDAYHVNLSSVKKASSDGRKTYTYDVKIRLQNYSKAVNFYTQSLGLPNSSQIKSDNYKPTDEAAVKFSVDVLSKQLRKVEYVSNGTNETYTTYGIKPSFKPPTHTVGYQTLQKAVEAASK
jgi:hypothetical protein